MATSNSPSSDLDAMVNWSEERLLAEIGRSAQLDRQMFPPGLTDLVLRGRQWMEEHFDDIRRAVCSSRARSLGEEDAPVVVAAIADCLASQMNGPSVFAVSVLVYRYGIPRLCGERQQ
jgi:hypothetical protein